MMTTANQYATDDTKLIESHLGQYFERVDAYEVMKYCVRVRVIDKQFAGMRRSDRFETVNRRIRELPEEVQLDILMLVTLAPGEEGKSHANFEFEHPSLVEI